MKRRLISSLVICLALSTIGSADMNRQIWDIPVNENLAGVKAFHEDKRPDMLPFDPVPDIDEVLAESWWGDRANNYYANLWGWVTIPETGTYTWHMHGDNHSVLYISTDENWENVEEVASIDGWSAVAEWNKYPTQTSAPFQYSAGQQLAVWAIMVEGGGGDNLGIAWTLPGVGALSYITDHVSIIPPTPTTARSPSPDVDTNDISRDTTLAWGAGEFAATHDVYFGTNFGDVNDRAPGALIGDGITETSSDPGRLAFGETYYWTVDEVNGAPDFTIHAGKIWSFTVEPEFIPISINDIQATASSSFGASGPEQTVNHSGLVDDFHGANAEDMWISGGIPATIEYAFDRAYKLQELWIWNSNQLIEPFVGFGAKDVMVEHSLDGANWTALEGVGPLAQATGLPNYAANNMIDFGGAMAQHVRVTVNSVQGIAPQASLSEVRFFYVPTFARKPSPETGATDVVPDVMLSWGRNGREAGSHDVYVGTDSSNLSLADSVSESSLDTLPLDLQLAQSYAWRVDEVNEAMDPSTWEGTVWSFTTADTIPIDDMESYRDAEFLEIWATWVDGFDDPANGSLVGGAAGTPETGIVNGGSQSLPMDYGIGGAAQSEATRTFDAPMDWTGHGVQGLVLYFRGSSDNTGGALYVKINDARVTYDGEASNLMRSGWSKWYIPLADVAGNLSSVNSLTIGVDGGGAGVVYFDDIALTADARELVTPVAPGSEGLVAHYEFDGTTNDSAGSNHGTAQGGPLFAAGQIGQAMDFDGQDDFVETGKTASSLGIGGNDPRTVAAWVLTRSFNNGGIFDVGARSGAQDFCLRTLTTDNQWRIQYWGGANDHDFTYPTLNEWVHFGLIHDGTNTKLYADGFLIVDVPRTLNTPDTNPFQIGVYGWQNNFFNGLIDDVQVYNRALSDAEVAGMVGLTQPFDRP